MLAIIAIVTMILLIVTLICYDIKQDRDLEIALKNKHKQEIAQLMEEFYITIEKYKKKDGNDILKEMVKG